MLRTTVCAFAGLLVGIAMTALVLRGTNVVVGWMTAPQVFRIEYTVIYQTVVLGAGFGAVCGALVGLAGVVARAGRERPPGP
jgi:hypothetical protein